MFLFGKAGRDVLRGGAGDDILYGFGGDDSLLGGAGHDVLAGHEGNDTLSGGTGDDYLLGGLGTDVIDGGAGVDWAAYEDATAAVKVSLALTGWQATGGAGSDKLTGIENLYGSAFNDTLIGNAGVNYLSGGAGDDRLEGGAGDDHLEGGLGNDTIIGGDGWDVVSYDDATQGVKVALGSEIGLEWGTDHIIEVEDVYGSRFNDTLSGSIGDNYIAGQDGDDLLRGGLAGNDTLDGGNGDDFLVFDKTVGQTLCIGGAGFDTLLVDTPYDPESNVGLSFNMQMGSARDIEGREVIQFSSIEAIAGTTRNDTFFSSSGRDEIDGRGGSDRFVFTMDAAPSAASSEQVDTIRNLDSTDKISLGVVGASTNYDEQTSLSYADAFTSARILLEIGIRDIVAIGVGSDVYVFADSNDSNTLTTVIKLATVTVAQLDFGTFVA